MKLKIRQKEVPNLKDPIFIASWPGMGQVSIDTTKDIIKQLKLKQFAVVDSEQFFSPHEVDVDNGKIILPLSSAGRFYYKKGTKAGDLIIFIADAQPLAHLAYEYSNQILDFVKKYDVSKVFTFAAMPTFMGHLKRPRLWVSANDQKLLDGVVGLGVLKLEGGKISGLNGLFAAVCSRFNISAACILADIPAYTVQIENPKACLAILKFMGKLLGEKFNYSILERKSKRMDEQVSNFLEYIKETKDMDKIEEYADNTGEDSTVHNQLPGSARENIEKLFREVKIDPSKAALLKNELDRWNVYHEYEDRFLDLFKRDN